MTPAKPRARRRARVRERAWAVIVGNRIYRLSNVLGVVVSERLARIGTKEVEGSRVVPVEIREVPARARRR